MNEVEIYFLHDSMIISLFVKIFVTNLRQNIKTSPLVILLFKFVNSFQKV
jgi:hypothetical protein